MLNTYHFAYSGQDGNGVTSDASLLIDEETGDVVDSATLGEKLTAFLKACGWQKVLVTIK
jgi:hypothetical protein